MSGTIDTIPAGNIYPSYEGISGSLGIMGTSPGGTSRPANGMPDTVPAVPDSLGGSKNLFMGGVVFFALLLGLMFLAEHVDGEVGNFKSIKVSFYNALVIGLAAILVIPVFKYLFTKVPVPGITPWVLAT